MVVAPQSGACSTCMLSLLCCTALGPTGKCWTLAVPRNACIVVATIQAFSPSVVPCVLCEMNQSIATAEISWVDARDNMWCHSGSLPQKASVSTECSCAQPGSAGAFGQFWAAACILRERLCRLRCQFSAVHWECYKCIGQQKTSIDQPPTTGVRVEAYFSDSVQCTEPYVDLLHTRVSKGTGC
jgi:hypothetical protein